ncbi:serine-rich adhesin for platelets-like isoform X2 [Xenia sp. Carnegie-2017]|nr:serine-rich adhesin for platelets-like isoform X2 [Xenia sp. Carnegie-2017]
MASTIRKGKELEKENFDKMVNLEICLPSSKVCLYSFYKTDTLKRALKTVCTQENLTVNEYYFEVMQQTKDSVNLSLRIGDLSTDKIRLVSKREIQGRSVENLSKSNDSVKKEGGNADQRSLERKPSGHTLAKPSKSDPAVTKTYCHTLPSKRPSKKKAPLPPSSGKSTNVIYGSSISLNNTEMKKRRAPSPPKMLSTLSTANVNVEVTSSEKDNNIPSATSNLLNQTKSLTNPISSASLAASISPDMSTSPSTSTSSTSPATSTSTSSTSPVTSPRDTLSCHNSSLSSPSSISSSSKTLDDSPKCPSCSLSSSIPLSPSTSHGSTTLIPPESSNELQTSYLKKSMAIDDPCNEHKTPFPVFIAPPPPETAPPPIDECEKQVEYIDFPVDVDDDGNDVQSQDIKSDDESQETDFSDKEHENEQNLNISNEMKKEKMEDEILSRPSLDKVDGKNNPEMKTVDKNDNLSTNQNIKLLTAEQQLQSLLAIFQNPQQQLDVNNQQLLIQQQQQMLSNMLLQQMILQQSQVGAMPIAGVTPLNLLNPNGETSPMPAPTPIVAPVTNLPETKESSVTLKNEIMVEEAEDKSEKNTTQPSPSPPKSEELVNRPLFKKMLAQVSQGKPQFAPSKSSSQSVEKSIQPVALPIDEKSKTSDFSVKCSGRDSPESMSMKEHKSVSGSVEEIERKPSYVESAIFKNTRKKTDAKIIEDFETSKNKEQQIAEIKKIEEESNIGTQKKTSSKDAFVQISSSEDIETKCLENNTYKNDKTTSDFKIDVDVANDAMKEEKPAEKISSSKQSVYSKKSDASPMAFKYDNYSKHVPVKRTKSSPNNPAYNRPSIQPKPLLHQKKSISSSPNVSFPRKQVSLTSAELDDNPHQLASPSTTKVLMSMSVDDEVSKDSKDSSSNLNTSARTVAATKSQTFVPVSPKSNSINQQHIISSDKTTLPVTKMVEKPSKTAMASIAQQAAAVVAQNRNFQDSNVITSSTSQSRTNRLKIEQPVLTTLKNKIDPSFSPSLRGSEVKRNTTQCFSEGKAPPIAKKPQKPPVAQKPSYDTTKSKTLPKSKKYNNMQRSLSLASEDATYV